jgi:hypothetical protein
MKKLSLKSLDFTSNERLQKEQLKSVFGGYGGYEFDGFKCADAFVYCDNKYPNDLTKFNECMFFKGCIYE